MNNTSIDTTMHVAKGDRIFLTNTDSHAEVLREGILGISSSVGTECDDNIIRLYCGAEMEQVVNSTTGKNSVGLDIEVPVDVRTIGPAVLTSLGITEDQQTSLFQKFMVLPKATRRAQISAWSAAKDDDTLKAAFLSDLLTLLDDDDLFIRTQSDYLLGHLPEDVRVAMLTKLYQITDGDSRREMIVTYTQNKKNKHKTEEFLQGMYAMTMDSTMYLRMELTRAAVFRGNRVHITGDKASRIEAFLAAKSEEKLDNYSAIWRKRKYYRSTRTAARYANILLKNY